MWTYAALISLELTGSVGSVVLANGPAGILRRLVGDERSSFRATGAVVLHVELNEGSDSREEALCYVVSVVNYVDP